VSLTVTESQAVFDLLCWLAQHENYRGELLPETEAVEAMGILATAAGRRLQLSPDSALPALIVERIRAADSDGAAQAVAGELDAWRRQFDRVWNVPAPIRDAHDAWRRLQDVELGERLRDQTVDTYEIVDGVAQRPVLCAHAARNGEGAHWLNPGERCNQTSAAT
jgi:hypothetical protein